MAKQLANEYRPDYVSPPGDTLSEILEDRQMSQRELAERTGRTQKHINEIIKGKAPISPETAIQLERVLGVPSSFWNNRQRRFDEFLARAAEERSLGQNIEWVRNFPYKTMANRRWVADVRDPLTRLQNLLGFFGVASPDAWGEHWGSVQIAFRTSASFAPDRYALACWLRMGELVASRINCTSYDKEKFKHCLTNIRKLTTAPPTVFQQKVIDMCAECGVAVVFVKELRRTASGATRWLSQDKALLQLSLKYKTDDHLWFTFFHEAAHILLHKKRHIFIEGIDADSPEEREANRFAANTLIPPEELEDLVDEHVSLSQRTIATFARRIGIAPGIVVGRLQHEGLLDHWSKSNGLKRKLVWAS